MTNHASTHSRRAASVVLILLVLTFFGACVSAPVSMDTPEGFAAFSEDEAVRAISPEGVLVRVRSVENEPEQSLEFWAEVLERQLLESGYLFVERGEFAAVAGPGIYLEWLAPVGADDYIYLTGLSVHEGEIVIVEAAGEANEYQRHRSRLIESLESISINDSGSGNGGDG